MNRKILIMGNHDRRDNFLQVWPEYAKTSPVKGRIVSKVEMPHVDLLMLDTLNGPSDGNEAMADFLLEQSKDLPFMNQ